MKVQNFDDIIMSGATKNEAESALEMFRVLRPALTVKRSNGRIMTTYGDKTVLGFYRTVKYIVNKESGIGNLTTKECLK